MQSKNLLKLLLLALCIANHTHPDQKYLLSTLEEHVPLAQGSMPTLRKLLPENNEQPAPIQQQMPNRALYRAYPNLNNTLAHVNLGDLPTPVQQCTHANQALNTQLYIKCDNLTGKLERDGNHGYGGNKIRKLEFLLADAQVQGAKTVLTFGFLGSQHAAATAASANALGLQCICLLAACTHDPALNCSCYKNPPLSRTLRKNLLLMHYYEAQLKSFLNVHERALGAISACLRNKLEKGDFPYVIPTGGSCPRGAIGFVNAAFELKEQINAGLLPTPDYIYAPSGSMGTISGLVLGLRAAGIDSKVVPICVEPEDAATYPVQIKKLIKETNDLLTKLDPAFPTIDLNSINLEFVHDCCGQDYGIFSPEGVEAASIIKQTENVILDGTYSGKAFAGLVRDARAGKLAGKKVLFWNTYCADDFKRNIGGADYKKLPAAFHAFFENDVQPLDK